MIINRQGVALQMSPSACESITMLFWIILEQDPCLSHLYYYKRMQNLHDFIAPTTPHSFLSAMPV